MTPVQEVFATLLGQAHAELDAGDLMQSRRNFGKFVVQALRAVAQECRNRLRIQGMSQ